MSAFPFIRKLICFSAFLLLPTFQAHALNAVNDAATLQNPKTVVDVLANDSYTGSVQIISILQPKFGFAYTSNYTPVHTIHGTLLDDNPTPGSVHYLGGGVGTHFAATGDYLISGDVHAGPFFEGGALEFYKKDPLSENWNVIQPPFSTGGFRDRVGIEVMASGDWLFVGATGTPIGDLNPNIPPDFKGSVYIFHLEGNPKTWVLTQIIDNTSLPALNLTNNSQLGNVARISVDGKTGWAILSANNSVLNSTNTLVATAGSVYFFQLDKQDNQWKLKQTVHDPAGIRATANFGNVVAMSGHYAMVRGLSAASDTVSRVVYVYKMEDSNWNLVQTIRGDILIPNPALFGTKIIMYNDHALITDTTSASAYFYLLQGGQWVFTNKDTGVLSFGGSTIALDDTTAAIGDAFFNNVRGIVRVYKRDNTTWKRVEEIVDNTNYGPVYVPGLGFGVVLNNNYLFIGAPTPAYEPIPGTNFIGQVFVYKPSKITYENAASLNNDDTFHYKITDSLNGSSTGKVTISP